jgi:hypothetical protein
MLLLTFISLNAVQIRGEFQPNAIMNLTQVLYNEICIIDEYEVTSLNDNSRLPFEIDQKMQFKVYGQIVNDIDHPGYFQVFKVNGKEWIKEGKRLMHPSSLVDLGFRSVQQAEVGDVLSEIFDCWTLMDRYVSRLYFLNKLDHQNVRFKVINKKFF